MGRERERFDTGQVNESSIIGHLHLLSVNQPWSAKRPCTVPLSAELPPP